jgi:molecular chaperone GrpE
MVNKKDIKNTNNLNEIDVTIDSEQEQHNDTEIRDEEVQIDKKIKALREKLKVTEEKQRAHLEELQRAKADFLNAKRRLEDEKNREKHRSVEEVLLHILPLCDSFHMAMQNNIAWEKADTQWRKGIEGIYAQLKGILSRYGVTEINPIDETFNPTEHEALSIERVANKELHNQIRAVMQMGYKRNQDGNTTIIRPARVVVAEYEESN